MMLYIGILVEVFNSLGCTDIQTLEVDETTFHDLLPTSFEFDEFSATIKADQYTIIFKIKTNANNI